MKNYPLWKIILVFFFVSLGVIFAIPSLLYQDNSNNWYLDNRVNLGLDLQGGSYLLLEVQSDVLFKEELENFSDTVRLISRELKVKIVDINLQDEELTVRFDESKNLEEVRKKFILNYRNVTATINQNSLKIKINDQFKKDIQDFLNCKVYLDLRVKIDNQWLKTKDKAFNYSSI